MTYASIKINIDRLRRMIRDIEQAIARAMELVDSRLRDTPSATLGEAWVQLDYAIAKLEELKAIIDKLDKLTDSCR